MEESPCEAIKNNVRGTRLLAQAAEFYGVDRFIFISTDKAVNPTSVMGASKRLAEMAIQTQAMGSGTSFAIVRFGNVLGSNGSVVPRFLEQIRKGGPVTVTHPEMRRFFMLIPEAVQLVLHAAAQAESGGTYVLEMGEQVKLVDMARDLIRLAGFVPDEEIAIAFTGLRPGEKLYEELVGINEVAGQSRIEKIHRVTSRTPPDPDFFMSLESIERQAADGDVKAVRASLKVLIPEYCNPAEVEALQTPEPVEEAEDVDADRTTGTGTRRRGRAVSVLPELHFGQGAPLARAQPRRAHAPQHGPRAAVPLRRLRLARLVDAARQHRERARRSRAGAEPG